MAQRPERRQLSLRGRLFLRCAGVRPRRVRWLGCWSAEACRCGRGSRFRRRSLGGLGFGLGFRLRLRLDHFLQARQPPVGPAPDAAAVLLALLVQGSQTFVEPGGTVREVRSDERMDDLVYQRPRSRVDVHDQRLVLVREVTERRVGRVAEDLPSVLVVAGFIFEQPDLQDLVRVLREVLLLQMIDGPLHGARRMPADLGRRLVAGHDKRFLDDNRKAFRGFPFDGDDALRVFRVGEPGRGMDVADLAGHQPQADHRPAVGVVLERPQVQELQTRHPRVGSAGHGRLVVQHLVFVVVVTEDQPKVLAGFGRVVVARADDRRHARQQVRVQGAEMALQFRLGLGRGDREPDRSHAEPDPRQGSRQFLRVAASPQFRIEPCLVEHVVLVDAMAQLGQNHRRTGLAAEIRLLLDVRHALDADAGISRPLGRRWWRFARHGDRRWLRCGFSRAVWRGRIGPAQQKGRTQNAGGQHEPRQSLHQGRPQSREQTDGWRTTSRGRRLCSMWSAAPRRRFG